MILKIQICRLAVGLDDFAETGQLSKEYFVSTYSFKNLKLTSGVGWGKFVGDDKLRCNPLSYIKIPLVIDKKVQITILVDLHHVILGLGAILLYLEELNIPCQSLIN